MENKVTTEVFTLKNGMRVVCERLPYFRSVAMRVWVNTGSVYERDGEHGISHFIEHMLFKGTTKRSAKELAIIMDAIGGNMNAFTAKEDTCFYAKVLDEEIETAADVLSDILYNSRMDAEDIEREKGVVTEEILMTEDSPEDVAHEALCKLYYEGSPIALPILGTRESVAAFTRDDIKGYMQRHYTPKNTIIAVAGNFEREKLEQLLNEKFNARECGEWEQEMHCAPVSGRHVVSIEKDVEQVNICLGLPGYAQEHPRGYALAILSNAFGGSMSSRLFQKIREEKGLAYTVYSYTSAYRDSGYTSIYAGTGEAQAQKVVELILKEIDDIRKNHLTKDEFERSREQIRSGFLLAQESTSARAGAIGKAIMTRGEVYSEEEILRKLDAVTQDDVNECIEHVFGSDSMAAALVGRMNRCEGKLRKLLE